MTRVVLTVAGSDSGGGAGIQADLKTACALGVHAATVLTAVTAQNTRGVHGVHEVPVAMVRDQLRAVLDDLDVAAVKIGMLGSPALVETVATELRDHPAVVLDPVMVATSGDRLLPQDAEVAVRELLVPLARVVTPNLPEARALVGRDVPSEELGEALLGLGAGAALVKGGHAGGDASDDLLVEPGRSTWLRAERVDTPNTHGTGCTLSSALACGLVQGLDVLDAARQAKAFLHDALVAGARLSLGSGHGPVDHLVRR